MLKHSRKAGIILTATLAFIIPLSFFGKVSSESTGSGDAASLPGVGAHDTGLTGNENTLAPAHQLKSLEGLLNADGTVKLNTGFCGSLDVSGWKMAIDRNGEPRFGSWLRNEAGRASRTSQANV